MGKSQKECVEFRFYEKPDQEPVIALTGEKWNRDYGEGNEALHFHNMAEIGYCYNGKGQVVLDKESLDYQGGSFTFIPQNYSHTTISDGSASGSFCILIQKSLFWRLLATTYIKGKRLGLV